MTRTLPHWLLVTGIICAVVMTLAALVNVVAAPSGTNAVILLFFVGCTVSILYQLKRSRQIR
jgi:CBS-domain-containing membrane protein